jgi:hypothetical protein
MKRLTTPGYRMRSANPQDGDTALPGEPSTGGSWDALA